MSEEHYVLVTDMLQKVTDALAASRPRVRKELDRIMNGQILADPIEELLEQGRAEGLSAGRAEGRAEGVDVLLSLAHDGLLDAGVAASKAEQAYGMPPEEFHKRLAVYGPATDSIQEA